MWVKKNERKKHSHTNQTHLQSLKALVDCRDSNDFKEHEKKLFCSVYCSVLFLKLTSRMSYSLKHCQPCLSVVPRCVLMWIDKLFFNLFSAHPEAHHSMWQPPENQEGAGEITGDFCPWGWRHNEYKRLLPCPRERLQLLMRVRKTQVNSFSRWIQKRKKYLTWLLFYLALN